MDIIEELERAIPTGPALPPPAQRIAAGRTALRRRRLAVASGAAVAVVALIVPVAALGGSTTDRGTEAPPAGPAPATSDAEQAPAWPKREDGFAYVDIGTGELRIHPAAVVHERRDDVYPGQDKESVALDLSVGDQRQWVLLQWDDSGAMGSIGRPEDGLHETFDDFVSETSRSMTSGPRRSRGGDDAMPTPTKTGLRWTGNGFATTDDTRILEQRRDLDLPESFAGPDATVGAALVELAGVRSLVLYRDLGDGAPQLISVEATGHDASLDEALAWARERYRSGAGLL